MNKMEDWEDQYDKIYRYCYFKVHHRQLAEDLTQETFLRFWESRGYREIGKSLQYLYTIARNLCVDEFRKPQMYELTQEESKQEMEKEILERLAVQAALGKLDEEDRELLLLRYANDVPITVIGGLFGISRFAVRRRLMRIEENLKENLKKEGISWIRN